MPSAIPTHKPLSKTTLPIALSSAKTQIYTDAPAPSHNTRNQRSAPLNTSSTSQIRTIAWSPLGNLIATADARTLRVWNSDRPDVKFSTELKPTPVPAGAGTGGTNGRPAVSQSAAQHMSGVERVAWNPDREAELSSVGADGVVRFWDIRSKGQCVGEVKVGGEGFSLAWRKGGEELVVGRKVIWRQSCLIYGWGASC